MKVHLLSLPRLLAERRSSAILGVIIILMLWTGVVARYIGDTRDARREAEKTNRNFAIAFEENVLRSIGEIDKALLYLRRAIETRKETTDFHTIAATTDVLSEIIVQVAIIDAGGTMRASNVGPQPARPLDLSDREHYRVHVGSNDDKLFISKPLVGRASGKWSVQFTRRFSNADGSLAGVVVASLDPAHLTRFYDKMNLGASAAIALIGSDGIVRSSGGRARDLGLGRDLAGTGLLARIRAGDDASFQDLPATDSPTQLVTIRKIAGHPLWVSIAVDTDEIDRGPWNDLEWNLLVALLLTLATLAGMEWILRTEAAAKLEHGQLQLTLASMRQGIMLVTKDGQIPILNRRCVELLGLPSRFLAHPPRLDQLRELSPLIDGLPAPSVSRDVTSTDPMLCERTLPNGTILEIRAGRLPDGGILRTFTDITKRRAAEANVARLAAEDPLTGLPNRRVFHGALEQMCAALPNASGDASLRFATLFLDLDRFKIVNDTLGHQVGDALLRQVAQRLRTMLQPGDVLARLGGDEFAILVSSLRSRDELQALATRLNDTIGEAFTIDGHRIETRASIGIAVAPADSSNADDLLKCADLALYAVKAAGRGNCLFFDASMNDEINRRRQVEIDLREAIERSEIELCYQPMIDLHRDRLIGFEALARWRHPQRGLLLPSEFIAFAEDSGLIVPIGMHVLTEACRQAALWPQDLGVSVNLSPVQLSAPDLCRAIRTTLADTGLAPHRLELEITERTLLQESGPTRATLQELKRLGIRIAMDDFGTGYSSLSCLRSFPYDRIKIDRSFICDLGGGVEHLRIVQAVVGIAQALDMKTTAEGVETDFQKETLAAIGCDDAQGHLFSPAVAVEQLPGLITRWTTRRLVA